MPNSLQSFREAVCLACVQDFSSHPAPLPSVAEALTPTVWAEAQALRFPIPAAHDPVQPPPVIDRPHPLPAVRATTLDERGERTPILI
ncbi:hypothetical protein [Candidatus Chloroploca asiatica]|uniref:Uncharacterized protein n=1 Tax=Candidatus Chloroploca asiatica TaxID=1506545 RepID=A0A2H3KKR2_9CHLR|nr:hypothetical protein [Candidatus Chloroploca asiatica]PDV98625.1 hypothetical protein A9Q02_14670 [Candidatus Chloroploca asiatica]